MALFGEKKTKEQKQAEEMQKFMAKYGLESIAAEDLAVIRRIANDLAGNGFFKMGLALSFTKAEEQAKVTYLSALVEQNWLIINQLSRLNQRLDSLDAHIREN